MIRLQSIDSTRITYRDIQAIRNLIAACLRQAYLDIFNLEHVPAYRFAREQIRKNALYWFASRNDEPWSFEWCCISLDLDARKARLRVRDLLEENGILYSPKYATVVAEMMRL